MTTMYDGRDLTEQSLADLSLGKDLGILARAFVVKTSESILACAKVIHKAYDLYYAPRARRGRQSHTRNPGDRAMERQWTDFLESSGFRMPDHYKLLRQYWKVGKCADLLQKYSENLPNSLDGIVVLCEDDVTYGEFLMVIHECNPLMTAVEMRNLISVSRMLPPDLDDSAGIPDFILGMESANDVSNAKSQLRNQERIQADKVFPIRQRLFKKALQEKRDGSMGLFSVPAIEMTQDNLADIALAMLVLKNLGLYPERDEELEFGKPFTQVLAMFKDHQLWKSSVVFVLKRLKEQSELALTALKLANEQVLIESEPEGMAA